ncbi:MAG TPA: hypothetical protein VHC96_09960 [Puia sp.]|nr:hypothetical protein [Puia sp.]
MTLPTQHIIRHLFRVDTLEEVSRQQLEELVEEYPSFGVGRYLLSRKLQAETADRSGEETQKTNLYFTNPFWLQWLLEDQAPRPVTEWRPAPEWNDTPAPVDPVPEEPSFVTEEWNAAGEAELPAEEVFAPVTDPTEATIDTTMRQEEEPDEVGSAPPAGPEPPAGPSAADLLLQSIAAIQDEREAQRKESEAAAVREETEPPVSIAGLALEQVELEENAPEGTPATEIYQEEPVPEVAIPGEVPAPVAETYQEEPAPETEPPVEIEVPEAPVPEIPAPEEEKPAAPVFEPYYTVDYFASQGIRLVQEENPSDKLGKQLKSFTDWLKVMRRLPQKSREIVPDIAAERQVQAIAAHSIEGREVVTEAMAEVLAKQGMREKATEMYRKLSLLEPEKSAYFATRIEQLKII